MRLTLLVIAALLTAASADTIDFGRQVVVVTAIEGQAVDQSAAGRLSKRAVDLLRGASYDRDWTVGAWLDAHPAAARKLDRMSLENRRAGTRYLSDGTVSADHDFPLRGAILTLLLPPTGGGRLLGRVACPCCGQEWPEGREPGPNVTLQPFENGSAPAYTGILIDARGVGFRPALFPRVVNEDNKEVIGPAFETGRELAQVGAFGYYTDRAQAMSSERVGSNPLVVRALSASGENGCDLVVSQYDAGRIHGSRANIRLLEACRVGLLVD